MLDRATIERVKEELNLSFRERDDVAPFICGTVVEGGFTRKLKMLRCDMFMMLSACQSSIFVHKLKQSRAIKRGIIEMIKRSQDIGNTDEILPFFIGWDKRIILDKALCNETSEVSIVNMPRYFEAKQYAESFHVHCVSYVYAAYLPPGIHQFLIFCPKTQRLFVKDIVIDLNQSYIYSEYPRKPKAGKKTMSNVWRTWHTDSPSDVRMALISDMVEDKFNPNLFLADMDDIEQCKNIFNEWFHEL